MHNLITTERVQIRIRISYTSSKSFLHFDFQNKSSETMFEVLVNVSNTKAFDFYLEFTNLKIQKTMIIANSSTLSNMCDTTFLRK